MGLGKKLGIGTLFVTAVLTGTYCFASWLKSISDAVAYDEEKAVVYQILDTDGKNGISPEEFKPFAEITGAPSWKLVSREDVRMFLKYNPE
jgi:hypothetical protein